MLTQAHKPVVGFAAFSGTGKTTLLKKLIPLLVERGVRVALIKHAHHAFDIDRPGKDSFELRKAGASQVLVASRQREALMIEKQPLSEPCLDTLISRLNQDELDLIVVEGFKHVAFPKIELYRPALGKPALYPDDVDIIAVATDATLQAPTDLPVLDINDEASIAVFVMQQVLGE